MRTRPVLVGGFIILATLSAAAVRQHASPSPVRLEAGQGRATLGGQSAASKPRAVKAVRGRLERPKASSKANVLYLRRAHTAIFDVRHLKSTVVRRERPEHPAPGQGLQEVEPPAPAPTASLPRSVGPQTIATAAAPAPDSSFDGLDYANWGAGHPPDTNGDVGPSYYIQTINTSIGIYDKSNGNRVAAFTYNAFMSQGNFGNLCDTNNFGDPVVLYDSFENRWFVTDFAFKLDASGNVNPQHVYQCIAASKTADPVAGGWNFYSIEAPGGLDDYPKFGIWPDGIYMSANMFGYSSSSSYISPHVWAINKAQLYAGAPTVQVVDFAGPSNDFTLLPANARLQAGTPPAGSPEYFASTEQFLNGLSIYKLHVDWDKISTSTFTGPDVQLAPTCWPNATPANASTTANPADVLAIRAMAQTQYSNIGGAESLWVSHTVNRGEFTTASCGGANSNNATVRWYQANVTGGTVAANVVQDASFDPDGANTFFRFMPSLAVDRAGDLAVGYTKSNSTTNPQIKYAGRLAGDPLGTFSQSEQTLINGTGSQSGNCGSSACVRWGDYSGMALDPNGCEFWETGEYYATTGLNHQTRIGSFHYPSCTTVGNGSISGTVTDGTNPIVGATVALGTRTATTDASGNYALAALPAGTYPSISANKAGFDSPAAASISVPDGGTATRNFTLAPAAPSGCFTDNTQTAFQRGIPSNCDLVKNPGSVVLSSPDNTAARNSTVSPSGFGFSNTTWAGQSFTPTVTGKLMRADVELFCSGCSGTNPDITVSLRATTGATPVPTGADLAVTTLPGFNDGGAGGLKTVTFATPATVTAGTRYALIFRATAARTGVYAYTCSCATTGYSDSNPYAGGQRVTSSNSGSTWTADTTVGGRDLNFVTYINPGFASSGTFVSSLKDANPTAGRTPTWTTLSFAATTPTGTSVTFQVAGSNSATGPFNYVGPDGTSSTFFTASGASLSQFNGYRYLRYEAFLSTADGTVTPSLSSVQVCFADLANATTLAVAPATGTYGGATTLAATLTTGGSGLASRTVAFTLNGSSVGSATTDGSGVATLAGVSLAGIDAGSYPSGVAASFAGDGSDDPSNGTSSLTVAKADQTIDGLTIGPGGPVYNSTFVVSATGGASGNPVTFGSAGACSNTGATFTMTSGTGSCTVLVDQAGNGNYNAAPEKTASIVAQKAPQTLSVATAAPTNAAYRASFTVAATATSGIPVTFASAGACSNAGPTFTMTSGTGTCTVEYEQAGNANYDAAVHVTESVAALKASQTIAVTGSAPAKQPYKGTFDVAASSSSGLGVAIATSGACSGSGIGSASVTITSGAGTCTIDYDQGGDANSFAAPQVTETTTAQKASQTVAFEPLAPKTYGAANFVLAASASSGLAVSFAASGDCSVSGNSIHISGAGSCAVTASQGGDANYNDASASHEFPIAKATLTAIPSPTAFTRQYSDPNPVFAPAITGFVNGENASALSTAPTCSTTATPSAAPGSYPIACSGGSAANYGFSYPSGALTVVPEDARAAFDGKRVFETRSPSSTKAGAVLSAEIRDISAAAGDPAFDSFGGDLRYARVSFVDRATKAALPGCSNLSVTPALPTDATVGTATCKTSLAARKAGTSRYTLGIVVSGFYARNDSADDEVVSVVRARVKQRSAAKDVVLCYRHRTVELTKARAKLLRKQGARLGACKKR